MIITYRSVSAPSPVNIPVYSTDIALLLSFLKISLAA